MTGYLTSVLTLLLSWMRGVASSIWKLINGESEGGFWAMLSENWKGILLAAVILVLTRWVKPTKKLHPIVFILASAVAGAVLGF